MTSPNRERRGAHRPSGLGAAGAVPWLVAAVAIVAIVGWATGWWRGGDSGTSGSNTVSAGPSAATGAPTTKGPSAATSGSSPTSASSAPSGPSGPPATVERDQSVTVLNGTSRSGLAAGAASRLREAGWTVRATGNSTTGGPTSVYYGKAALRATAAAVAQDLGAPAAVRESADFGASRITVVLGSDYPG